MNTWPPPANPFCAVPVESLTATSSISIVRRRARRRHPAGLELGGVRVADRQRRPADRLGRRLRLIVGDLHLRLVDRAGVDEQAKLEQYQTSAARPWSSSPICAAAPRRSTAGTCRSGSAAHTRAPSRAS
jgi:hypothetical protein